ncbi:hypothetical protein E2C01_067445 [Portunus trituberculatus]|uniref:Uncharacterized protein n=1 Tax=Portunus trituberculatus TaxID=210409 RepID=A0A5B7HV24_PORTR|nr:hypothetical protein [Portunus trituberculatus]
MLVLTGTEHPPGTPLSTLPTSVVYITETIMADNTYRVWIFVGTPKDSPASRRSTDSPDNM